ERSVYRRPQAAEATTVRQRGATRRQQAVRSVALRRHEQADRMAGIEPGPVGAPMIFTVGRAQHAFVGIGDHLAGAVDDVAVRPLAYRLGLDLLAIELGAALPRISPAARRVVSLGGKSEERGRQQRKQCGARGKDRSVSEEHQSFSIFLVAPDESSP